MFGGIDAALAQSVDRLWGEVANALRVRLTDAIVPTGSDHRAILFAFADRARQSGARTLNAATDRLLDAAHRLRQYLLAGRSAGDP